jgi:hypothetical protein
MCVSTYLYSFIRSFYALLVSRLNETKAKVAVRTRLALVSRTLAHLRPDPRRLALELAGILRNNQGSHTRGMWRSHARTGRPIVLTVCSCRKDAIKVPTRSLYEKLAERAERLGVGSDPPDRRGHKTRFPDLNCCRWSTDKSPHWLDQRPSLSVHTH